MIDAGIAAVLDEKLCDLVDVLLQHHDPCQRTATGCLAADPNPCCQHTRFGTPCKFWKADKCEHRNASCKLWFCQTAIANMRAEMLTAMEALEDFAAVFGLVEPPLLGETYYGADRPIQ